MRRSTLAVLVTLTLLPVTGLTGLNAFAATTSCTSAALVPQLRSFNVSQGVSSYALLTRGKETLVQPLLSLPACASRSQSVSLTAAALTMTGTGTAHTYSPLSPLSASSPAPLISYAGAPVPDPSGDPKFVVPGGDLASSSTGRFPVGWSLRLSFRTSSSSTVQSKTFTSLTGSTTALASTVEQRTRALRILVVPMGQPLSANDTANLEAGLNQLAREWPVPKSGGQLIGPLTADSRVGGIRYAINSGAVALPSSPFCGGLSNFTAIKTALNQFRQDWNLANSASSTNPDGNPTADLVLGVVSSSISRGGDFGCAEGMASINSPEAWVRLDTGSPSATGADMAMELAHTLGAEGLPWSDPNSAYHSRSVEADAGGNSAYNVTSRSFLSGDRTVMRNSGAGWNQDTVVYEPRDYAFLLCRLGGQANPDCSTSGSTGTVNGVASGPMVVMSGTTGPRDNPTPANTSVLESYFSNNVAPTAEPASSDYSLQLLHDSSLLCARKVFVNFTTSEHDQVQNNPDHSAETLAGLFSFAYPLFDPTNCPANSDPNHFRLVWTPPGGGTPVTLYERNRNGLPQIGDVQVTSGGGAPAVSDFTNDPTGQELDPTESTDGSFVAWVDNNTRLSVAPTSDVSKSQSASWEGVYPTQPALNAGASQIAFVDDSGSLDVADIDTSGPVPAIGDPTIIYNSDPPSVPFPRSPSYSVNGEKIAFAAGGDLYTINTDGTGLTRLTSTGDVAQPSWSRSEQSQRIAFERVQGESSSEIWTIDPTAPDPAASAQKLVDFGAEPSFGRDGRVAYYDDGTWVSVDASADNPGDTRQSVLPSGQDDPSDADLSYVNDGLAAFDRAIPNDFEGNTTDVMLLGPAGDGPPEVRVTGGFQGGDNPDPGNLRLTLYYQCPQVPEPSVLALAVTPSSTSGGQAQFDVPFDETGLCGGAGGGQIIALMTDGISITPFPGQLDWRGTQVPTGQQTGVSVERKGAVATIVTPDDAGSSCFPSDGLGALARGCFYDWQSISLQGEGTDQLNQLPDSQLTWTITSSANGSPAATRQGSTVDLPPLPAGGYDVRLDVDDGHGNTDSSTRYIVVVGDADRDGLPQQWENQYPCLGADPDNNILNMNEDPDGDGIPNALEIFNSSGPCTPAQTYHPATTFDPQTLYVPSNGNYVTVTVTRSNGTPDLKQLVPSSVRLLKITGIPLSGGAAVTRDVSGESFSLNKSWTVAGGTGTAKFDRQGLDNYLKSNFKLAQRVTFTFGGASFVPAWSFTSQASTTIKKG